MDDLISRQALYDRAATLEAQALDYVGKLIERDGDEYSTEWKIWSAILAERTAFKHDVFDAPSAQRTGRWIFETLDGAPGYRPTVMFCSKCGRVSIADYSYCPNCGARMEGNDERT